MKKLSIIIISIFLIMSACVCYISFSSGKVEALSKYGSSGSEVKQIQEKLKNWGYYSGNVDGIYGSKTQEAVKKFQKANGLTVDGIAGEKTLAAMGITSSGNSSTGSSSSSDLNLLSRLVYGEARGEEYTRAGSSCSCCAK